MTLEQVKRMRRWVITQFSDHALQCQTCRELLPCEEKDRLFALLHKWSLLDIEMQQAERRQG